MGSMIFKRSFSILTALLLLLEFGIIYPDRVDANGLYRTIIKNAAGATQFGSNVIATQRSTDAPAYVNSSNFDSLNSAVTAIGGTPSTLIVINTLPLTSDCVVPPTLEIQVVKGGTLSMHGFNLITDGPLKVAGEINSTTGKLTVNGPFEGAISHIFTGSPNIVFGNVINVFPEWWGARGDGIADDTTAVQKSISSTRKLLIVRPKVSYRLTSPISITRGISIVGNTCEPYIGGTPGTRGQGSWFFLDHLGVGFNIVGNVPNNISGVIFEKIGTYREQPHPRAGWSPLAADWDFNIANADVTFNGCVLLNPTKGIRVNDTPGGGYGRLTINDLVGQPLTQGIEITNSFDTFRGTNIRFWPYWKDDDNVHAYCLNNLVAFKLCRCDNPMLMNIFTIFAKYGIQFSSSVNGVTQGAMISNLNIDRFGLYGIYVDKTTNAVLGSITNIFAQGETDKRNTIGIELDGNNSILSFNSIRLGELFLNAIKETTGNALIRVSGLQTNIWNKAHTNQPMIYGTPGSRIYVDGTIIYTTNDNSPQIVNNVEVIRSDEWVSYSPSVTSTIGTLGSYTAKAKVKHHNGQVFIIGEIIVNNNGTGAGALAISIPFIADSFISIPTGKNVSKQGKVITGVVSGNLMQLVNVDGSYPVVSPGDRIVFNAMYSVAR